MADQLLRRSSCQGCGAEITQPISGSRTGRNRKWCSDRCRKRTLYGGTCKECGATTNGYGGPGTASDVCWHCAPAENAKWTRESIITAIQAWASEHDSPPHAPDWNTAQGRLSGRPARDIDQYPAASTVQAMFGSWNAAIQAAGFDPIGVGQYERPELEPRADLIALYLQGLTMSEVAVAAHVARGTVWRHVKLAGVSRPRGRRPKEEDRAAA